MSDGAVVTELVAKAYDETSYDGESFADRLREEADRYETDPDEARNPRRVSGGVSPVE